MCHHGVRSSHACIFLRNKGYKVINLEGGIDEISKIVEEIPRYR